MADHHLMIIGAERVDADATTEVRSPYDGRVLGTVPTGTTDTSGCPEAVRDGETGKVVLYEADAIANAAMDLLEDRDLAGQLASRGKIAVRERFNWDAMAKAYEEIFLRISDAKAARPAKV